jgi:hypothetical protein
MPGRKVFVANDILTAADVNEFLANQAVMVFADATARTTAIPSPLEGMVTYLASTKNLQRWTGSAWVNVVSGFTAQETISASNASWPVPALQNPIVKVTVMGSGGGGGAAGSGATLNAANGNTTTFNAGGAGSVSAGGGLGGKSSKINDNGNPGTNGFATANGGQGAMNQSGDEAGTSGTGGVINVFYLNLSGISTVNVTIGAGGAGATGANNGGDGGRGEVIVEYVAA